MTSGYQYLGASSLTVTLVTLLYLWGIGRAWSSAGWGRGISRVRAGAGLLGLITLAVALGPPMEALTALFFSAHMAQHLLLVLVAAPLLVTGVPLLALLWLLPRPARRKTLLGLKRNPVAIGSWRVLGHPLVAWTSFVLLLWLWHLPVAYEGALTSGVLHLLEHLSITASAALFWWVLLQPLGRRRLERLAAPLFLFLAAVQGGVLGAMITLAPEPWYGYYERIARAQGFSALDDQRLAGLLMWIPPSALYLGVACWMLYRVLTRVESRQKSEAPPLAHLNTLLLPLAPLALLGVGSSI